MTEKNNLFFTTDTQLGQRSEEDLLTEQYSGQTTRKRHHKQEREGPEDHRHHQDGKPVDPWRSRRAAGVSEAPADAPPLGADPPSLLTDSLGLLTALELSKRSATSQRYVPALLLPTDSRRTDSSGGWFTT